MLETCSVIRSPVKPHLYIQCFFFLGAAHIYSRYCDLHADTAVIQSRPSKRKSEPFPLAVTHDVISVHPLFDFLLLFTTSDPQEHI